MLLTGISFYRWCVGTQKYHCDTQTFTTTTAPYTVDLDVNTDVQDGAEYYLTVQVHAIDLLLVIGDWPERYTQFI